MRLPSLFRRTPFRLTLLFLALFAAAASAVLAYVYFASASEARARAQADVGREVGVLTAVYRERGVDALNEALVQRMLRGGPYLYLLMDSEGAPITGNLNESPIADYDGGEQWETFRLTDADPSGRLVRRQSLGFQTRLSGGELLFVGEDIGDTERSEERRVGKEGWGRGCGAAGNGKWRGAK